MSEENKEKIKEKGYSILDFFVGGLLLGLFIMVVVVSANGFSKIVYTWFPKLKPESDAKST
ncbi:hypothetical protein LV89_01823 [Arcicella aurantiaca]|uniref:Uncharacterized protein n=1 Tax=Arcicella aurantiaca TaxID=591202 RepID=A0A316EAP7_9BACT|nr:hypothetical protein [Arcicella aurantiaca]PWK27011.1 hypothetical protein LV89_01823 [Arcicella aurantiaca]